MNKKMDLKNQTFATSILESDEETDHESTKAAVKLQKVYRSYRTRRRLADSAVVAEELWWQAIEYARLNHSTKAFFNFIQPEKPSWFRLDIGDGKTVDLDECPRSRLHQECINYLGPQERECYEYIIAEGELIHKQTGDLLDTKEQLSDSKWIFVMSVSNKLYAGEKKKGMFHHSSFLAGGVTLAAGRLVAERGKLKSVSAYSGHYRPTDESLSIFLTFLQNSGVRLEEVQVKGLHKYTTIMPKVLQILSLLDQHSPDVSKLFPFSQVTFSAEIHQSYDAENSVDECEAGFWKGQVSESH